MFKSIDNDEESQLRQPSSDQEFGVLDPHSTKAFTKFSSDHSVTNGNIFRSYVLPVTPILLVVTMQKLFDTFFPMSKELAQICLKFLGLPKNYDIAFLSPGTAIASALFSGLPAMGSAYSVLNLLNNVRKNPISIKSFLQLTALALGTYGLYELGPAVAEDLVEMLSLSPVIRDSSLVTYIVMSFGMEYLAAAINDMPRLFSWWKDVFNHYIKKQPYQALSGSMEQNNASSFLPHFPFDYTLLRLAVRVLISLAYLACAATAALGPAAISYLALMDEMQSLPFNFTKMELFFQDNATVPFALKLPRQVAIEIYKFGAYVTAGQDFSDPNANMTTPVSSISLENIACLAQSLNATASNATTATASFLQENMTACDPTEMLGFAKALLKQASNQLSDAPTWTQAQLFKFNEVGTNLVIGMSLILGLVVLLFQFIFLSSERMLVPSGRGNSHFSEENTGLTQRAKDSFFATKEFANELKETVKSKCLGLSYATEEE